MWEHDKNCTKIPTTDAPDQLQGRIQDFGLPGGGGGALTKILNRISAVVSKEERMKYLTTQV